MAKFGGGGRIRTAVPRHQGKSHYMFILIFGFPAQALTGEILRRYPIVLLFYYQKEVVIGPARYRRQARLRGHNRLTG